VEERGGVRKESWEGLGKNRNICRRNLSYHIRQLNGWGRGNKHETKVKFWWSLRKRLRNDIAHAHGKSESGTPTNNNPGIEGSSKGNSTGKRVRGKFKSGGTDMKGEVNFHFGPSLLDAQGPKKRGKHNKKKKG